MKPTNQQDIFMECGAMQFSQKKVTVLSTVFDITETREEQKASI
jgi:hypothetical protein